VNARICLFAALVMGLPACGLRGGEPPPHPVSPSEVVRLFDGHDFTGLSTWLEDTKHNDPRRVFRITDGMLHITGDGFGYLATAKEYYDYHLIVEYRWGKRTDGGKFVRNSGILLNAIGPDGGAGGKWMASIECQLAQGCVGDLIVIRGMDMKGETIPVRLTSETALGPTKNRAGRRGANRGSSPTGNSGGLGTILIFRSCSTPEAKTMSRARRTRGTGSSACAKEAGSQSASTASPSTSVTTSSPRPARSCCNRKDSSCSCGSLNCTL
jgi:hypothetical protein